MEKYFGSFDSRDSVAIEFQQHSGNRWANPPNFKVHGDFPTDEEILLAVYNMDGYEGSAFVLYQRDGKLYEVNGSHCSCYGLENQWSPEETSWEALKMRKFYTSLDVDGMRMEEFIASIAPNSNSSGPYLTEIERAIQMLRVAAQCCRMHGGDILIHYDEADCDGFCVADECISAADQLEQMVNDAKKN